MLSAAGRSLMTGFGPSMLRQLQAGRAAAGASLQLANYNRAALSATGAQDDGSRPSSKRPLFMSAFAALAAGSWLAAGGVASADSKVSADKQAASPSPPPELKDSYARPAGATGRLPATITLWQYEVCPYCCKVKAFLDYHKLPYRVIEVNPLLKGELKWSDYKKVPVVKMDDEVVVDSSAIISRLAAELDAAGGGKKAKTGRRAPAKPTAAALEEEAKWRRWVDDKFVKVVTANIYRNWDESWRTFGYLTSETKWGWGTREVARVSGALLMWQIGQRMPTKYGITGDLRQALYDACNEFVDAVGPGRAFMGGSAPNLADLAVFGVMQAVHRMGAFDDMLQHSRIAPWYTRMAAAVGESSAIRAD